MSKCPENYSILQDVRAWLGRVDFNSRGTQLSDTDAALMRTLISYQVALSHDLLSEPNYHRLRSWVFTLTSLDVMEFGRFLGDLDTFIKSYPKRVETSELDPARWTYQSFKRSYPSSAGFWGFVSPIEDAISAFFSTLDEESFAIIIQWLNFLRRANLRDLDLSAELEQEYLSFEEEMKGWEYDEALLSALNRIIVRWFGSVHPNELFLPKHGPGSIAGRSGRPPISVKYASMHTDTRLTYLKKWIGDLTEYAPLGFQEGRLDRTSDIVYVPKSMITNRTISKEPASLQYFQQGAMKLITDYVHQHPYLSKRVDFRDQTASADLARSGSILGEYATVDLSAASDSVSFYLVKRLFAGTWIAPYLVCTRSDATRLPSGKEVKLAKFAPMGSALCFPIETIVFAACCERAKEKTSGHAYYRVFGDDIVIHQKAFADLEEILAACHFKMNKTKSFWGTTWHNFREACGGEYFNGKEVTPLRVSRKFQYVKRFTRHSADKVSSYISFANQAFERGFLQLRREILFDLKSGLDQYMVRSLVYSSDGRIGIQTFPDGVTNYRLETRMNRYTHVYEVFGLIPKSVHSFRSCRDCTASYLRDECEIVRYYEWLRRSVDRREPSDTDIDVCPSKPKLGLAWVPTAEL